MYDEHLDWDFASVDKKYLDEEWFDQRYTQTVAAFVSEYQQHGISKTR
ncbi:hypothetical protein [Domibacillus indicus]|nr:hypothetical protein [Domibacillus indicus]